MEGTLQAVGGNASSWETVFRHYEKEQPDALKLEVPRFFHCQYERTLFFAHFFTLIMIS